MNYISALAKANLLFWKAPHSANLDISVLIGANIFLFTFAQRITQPEGAISQSAFIALCALFLQFVSSLVVLLRGRALDVERDAPRFIIVLFVTWCLSLYLFIMSELGGLEYSQLKTKYAQSTKMVTPQLISLGVAVAYSILAVTIIGVYSHIRQQKLTRRFHSKKKVSARYRSLRRMRILQIISWGFVVFCVNSMYFYFFVTSQDVRERIDKLLNDVTLKVGC